MEKGRKRNGIFPILPFDECVLMSIYIFSPFSLLSSRKLIPGRPMMTWSAMRFPDGLLLPSFPFRPHIPRQFHNLPAQLHKVNGTLLQSVEQRHRLLLRKMATQFFHGLVVVRADGAELGVEVRQLGMVLQHRLVHLQHLELLPEEVRLEKDGFRVHL